ncbi:MAG: hypothetical protein MJK18_00735, partial [Bdellovibrionales bacterium]|nr:hypothetical protein [Bdellovibrionales bacterium]
MNLFQRIAQYLSGMFSNNMSRTERSNQHHVARGFIEKQKRSLKRLKESKTELIFQRKKFETQLDKLQSEKLSLKEDMEAAAFQGR